MNIAKLNALIPASFEYAYLDAEDQEQKETITLQLKRMSFTASASKTFREAMENEDTGAIAQMIAGLISSWNMDADGEAFDPTAENIGALPADFVADLAKCVFERLFPNSQRAANSPDGSELAESTASVATAS